MIFNIDTLLRHLAYTMCTTHELHSQQHLKTGFYRNNHNSKKRFKIGLAIYKRMATWILIPHSQLQVEAEGEERRQKC